MGEFRMPALGAGMDAGRVIEWYVTPGDRVSRGDIVALVETDKANIEVEVFEDGIVEELLVEPGTKVPVGTPLARIGAGAVAPSADTGADEVARAPAAPPAAHLSVTSPLVRRLAEEIGVDLATVRGSGPGGAVTRSDVECAAAGVRASPYARRLAAARGHDVALLTGTGPAGAVVARDVPAEETVRAEEAVPAEMPARPEEAVRAATPAAVQPEAREDRGLAMRQAIARAMERSNREIPHYYLGETVDVEASLEWLAEVNADRPPAARLLPAVLVLKATALALQRYPDLNGYWIDDAFRPGDGIHLGVAISLRGGGLLAPAIRHADQRSLDELMEALRDLVERTRSGGLRGSEMTDPTITVSNLGDTGVETVQGVITPPQVALVGVGRVTERPWAVDGMLAVRRTIHLSLAADHRASDGHRGGRFLGVVAANLTRPEAL